MTGVAAELISAARRSSGLSQAELARRAEVPRSVLNAYERGRRDPRTESLAHILAAAGRGLGTAPAVRRPDAQRAGRLLLQVLELAEELPFRRAGSLPPSPWPRPADEHPR